jgi:hypothetical protein
MDSRIGADRAPYSMQVLGSLYFNLASLYAVCAMTLVPTTISPSSPRSGCLPHLCCSSDLEGALVLLAITGIGR